MTEHEARAHVANLFGTSAVERLERLAALVVAGNQQQNLIARTTIPAMWVRHILDSVQLIPWAVAKGSWVDIGTGAGFPGLAVATVADRCMTLVEPRRQRADFLRQAAGKLGLSQVKVLTDRVERVDSVSAAVLSARAVAPIATLFDNARHCSSATTQWLLPRGAGWRADVEAAKRHWRGTFHVEQSLTDPKAGIVIATGVMPR